LDQSTQNSLKLDFGLLGVSPKSLFISFFDYVERRDEASIGTAIIGYKQEGFNPNILVTALLPTYRTVASYFETCLYQLCTTHARRDIARIIKDLISSRPRRISSS